MSGNYGYIGNNPGSSSVVVARQSFSPSGLTTTFIFDSGYSVGYLDAYLNGARLIEGQDYIASNGSTIDIVGAATTGDVLELVAYKAFNVVAVTDAPSDFRVNGKLTVNGNAILGVSNGIGTVTIGIGSTALYVDGNARITGILSVGQGTVTIDGSTNKIIVGTGVTIDGTSGIISARGLSVGVATASSFVGNLTGTASTATSAGTAYGLTGSPNVTVGTITGSAATFTNLTVNGTQTIINTTELNIADKTVGIASTSTPSDTLADGAGIVVYGSTNKTLLYDNTRKGWDFNIPLTTDEIRFYNVAEKLTRGNVNTVSLAYGANGSNVGFATNPTGDITLAVTGIPTSSDFDNHIITFSVFVNQTGTARSCTAITLNGVSRTIKWSGGSLSNAVAGVTTNSGYDIYSFTCINTVGSASTTTNYQVLGSVNGGYA